MARPSTFAEKTMVLLAFEGEHVQALRKKSFLENSTVTGMIRKYVLDGYQRQFGVSLPSSEELMRGDF